ncbi:MAG TPA: hypothetical protein VFV58_35705 [Blastocatellia bacterium]|nr:hypothetical protein [Blastocatellia bacterium]
MRSLAQKVYLLTSTAAIIALAALTVFAQSARTQPSAQNPPAQNPPAQDIEELRRKLVELDKEVQALNQSIKQLEEQQKRKQLEEQQKRETKQETQPPSTQPAGATGAQSATRRQRPISGVAKQETVSRDRETVARIDNQPLDPEMIGFFHIPGTQAKVKIDGYAKLDVMMDPRPAGDPDEFINTTFPVNLTPPQKVVMSNVSFRESRINLDFRSPFKEEEFRFYAEIDFFGPDGPTDPRLRHLYGQIKNVLAGHTWTTFSDPDIIPDTLDSERPASIIKTRQAQFRYTQAIGKHHSFAFSVERPRVRGPDLELDRRLICSMDISGFSRSDVERLRVMGVDLEPDRSLICSDVTGDFLRSDVERSRVMMPDIPPGRSLIRASVIRGFLRSEGEALLTPDDETPDEGPYNPAPDFVVRYRYERERGHLQFGSLYRALGFRNVVAEEKAFGWGLNFSAGVLTGKRDNLLISATYGAGIARYLNNLSDLDLDFDLANDGRGIRALPVIGAYGAYQHYWTRQLRSTVTFGYDRVQNTAAQPFDAFSKSYYTSANLIWRPLKDYHFTVGAEFLYGWQVLKGDSQGRANRVQLSLQYNLYRKPIDPASQ